MTRLLRCAALVKCASRTHGAPWLPKQIHAVWAHTPQARCAIGGGGDKVGGVHAEHAVPHPALVAWRAG